MIEKWLPVKGLEEKYQVSILGNVRNIKTMKNLSTPVDDRGYINVTLSNGHNNKPKRRIHRLIMESFFPCDGMEKLEINHKDGNKKNNNLINLEWCTRLQNQQHARRTGLCSQNGENSTNSKVTNKQAEEIRELKKKGLKLIEIGKIYGLAKSTVSYIVNKRTFK